MSCAADKNGALGNVSDRGGRRTGVGGRELALGTERGPAVGGDRLALLVPHGDQLAAEHRHARDRLLRPDDAAERHGLGRLLEHGRGREGRARRDDRAGRHGGDGRTRDHRTRDNSIA
nr:hypothetical protein [Kutzneria sp. 744]